MGGLHDGSRCPGLLIRSLTPSAHGNRTGTNIHDALQEIYHWIIFQKEALSKTNKPDEWKKVRHAVILLTDGEDLPGGGEVFSIPFCGSRLSFPWWDSGGEGPSPAHSLPLDAVSGKFNMGGSPKHAVTKIEDVLEVKPDRNDYLGELGPEGSWCWSSRHAYSRCFQAGPRAGLLLVPGVAR